MRNLRWPTIRKRSVLASSAMLTAALSVTSAQRSGCDPRVLGEAVVADTTRLRHVEISPSGESAEGSAIDVYYDGAKPRVVVVAYFGETGKAVTRFFLRDSANFVQERENVYYARPIGVGKTEVMSRVRQVAYFCNGKRVPEVGDSSTTGPKGLADLLRRAKASPP